MYYSGEVIVLKNIDFKETDKIVSVFSEQKGIIRAVARGIKKPKSSLRACIQPLCRSFMFFRSGKELELITQGKVIDFYGGLRGDLVCTLQGMYLLELVDKSLMEKMPYPHLYGELNTLLEYMNRGSFNPLLIRYFEIRMLLYLGYKPQLQSCVFCLDQGTFNYLSCSAGGVICPRCYDGERNKGRRLSGETISLLKLFVQSSPRLIRRVKASGQAMNELELCNKEFMEYHLDRRFHMPDTIRLLQN